MPRAKNANEIQWFCYGVQQTDKTSLGTQAIFGLREDTNLVGQQYSWLTTIFYIAYLTGEFPSNFLLQRWSLGKSLSIYMLCWGRSCASVGMSPRKLFQLLSQPSCLHLSSHLLLQVYASFPLEQHSNGLT